MTYNPPDDITTPHNYDLTSPVPPKKKSNKAAYILIGVVTFLALCCGGVAVVSTANSDEPQSRPERTQEAPATPSDNNAEEPVAAEPTPEPEETTPELTVAQQQAVTMAGDYLDYSGFSRTGLIEQLEFEGFSNSDAEFAVDYVDPDWMEQAVRVAQNYLDYTSFSRQGLIDQLEYEGFTTEQAEHGADEVGL